MKFKFTEIQSQVPSPVPGKEEPLAATTQAGQWLAGGAALLVGFW